MNVIKMVKKGKEQKKNKRKGESKKKIIII